MEIAAFDEFTALIGKPGAARQYDHIVFDTAPTGHTLRLMSLAKAWDQFLEDNTSGSSCLGPLAGLEKQRAVYEATVEILANPEATTLFLVSRPQVSALREAERTARELRELGVANQELIINGVFQTDCPDDPIAQAMQARGAEAMSTAHSLITSLPTSIVPLRSQNILGLDGLRQLLAPEDAADNNSQAAETNPASRPASDGQALEMASLKSLVADLSQSGKGVVMTMGKGGVGKTTVAAALAVALAHEGHQVHLSTTDPAAHLAQTLESEVPGLSVGRIDPAAETAAYRDEVLATQGAEMDQAGRALLEEDLRSPCTEEIAVFRAFAREVAKAKDRFVVLDTAPTGHTLLLLDASEAYQREMERQARNTQPEEVRQLLQRLRDPAFTRILLVTLPEATPVHEAAALQDDLRRAGIEPFAWIINQSLWQSGSCDALLRGREQSEERYLHEVAETHAGRVAWLPWQAEEPIGPQALAPLAETSFPKTQLPS